MDGNGTDAEEGDGEQWVDAEPYAAPVGGAWGGDGSGYSTPGKGNGGNGDAGGAGQADGADGADLAVEHYWEARGKAASDTTDLGALGADDYDQCFNYDGAGVEDDDMWAEAEGEDSSRSWTEELRAKKRRTEGEGKGGVQAEELKQVRDLGRVRSAVFDKKK